MILKSQPMRPVPMTAMKMATGAAIEARRTSSLMWAAASSVRETGQLGVSAEISGEGRRTIGHRPLDGEKAKEEGKAI